MMRLVALFALALAGCSEPAQSGPPIERVPAASAPDVAASVAAFYEPYTRPFAPGDPADWDRPIFSADLRRLIARWKAGFSDEEVAELQDFSWLCECQDWDSEAFEVGIEPHARPADGRVRGRDRRRDRLERDAPAAPRAGRGRRGMAHRRHPRGVVSGRSQGGAGTRDRAPRGGAGLGALARPAQPDVDRKARVLERPARA